MYDTYLFDADETLFDYMRAEQEALEQTCRIFEVPYENVLQKYRSINNALWKLFETQGISRKELKFERFARLFAEIGVKRDIEEFNRTYLYELGKGDYLLDGAYEICKEIHAMNKRIYVVTNGSTVVQKMRFGSSKIKQFISDIFISEEIGLQKPQKEYFEYVFSHIENFKISKTIIVGDSLTSDIKGGYNAGISTCWFNPNGEQNHSGITPTYEITDLSQIIGKG